MSKLHHFHGGMTLPGHKQESLHQGVQLAGLPPRLFIPVRQHIGEARQICIEIGERVLRGQIIAENSSGAGIPIHASSSGIVREIKQHPIPHPSGMADETVVIDVDGKDESVARHIKPSVTLSTDEMINVVRDAGIVGLGGAAFPTALKLDRGAGQSIHTLVINGVECEPYITCDDALMQEYAASIVRGIDYLQKIVAPAKTVIAIEDNKPEAISAMHKALKESPLLRNELVVLPTIYPSGGEKQLIQIISGVEIPQGKLAFDAGFYCQNVGTCVAIAEALDQGNAMTSRVVTLSGDGIQNPGNWQVRIGTPIEYLVKLAGGYTHSDVPLHLIMGGPMMGYILASDQIPIVKASNCILVMKESSIVQANFQHDECIRCGKCTEVCPAQLLPQQLYWHTRAKAWDKTEDYHLFDCIECGCCSAVCPSQIPLVQYYRTAKSEIKAARVAQQKSDRSRQRFEFREQRLLRKKAQEEERKRLKREALQKKKEAKSNSDSTASVADPVQAALERVKAKKIAQAANNTTARNTANLTPAQQKQIEEADARRKQQQESSL